MKAVAEAVHYAHSQGVLHRDLKPGNILVGPDDRPRIADFGLAKATDAAAGSTVTGETLGTPAFLPPEQVSFQRGAVGPFSDVYALGGVLYHALTGRPPFAAGSTADVLNQVMHAEPAPPRMVNPAVPRDLETICLKSLEKEPSRRYSSAQALAEDLNRWEQGEPIRARPASAWERALKWTRRRPAVASLLALLAVAVAVGAASAFWQSSLLRRAYSGTRVWLACQLLAEGNSQDALVSLARVVRDVPSYRPASAALLSALAQLNLPLPVGGPLIHPLSGSNLITALAFSPDSRFLVTASETGSLCAWPVDNMTITMNSDAASARVAARHSTWASGFEPESEVQQLEFSPDGRAVLAKSAQGLARLWEFPSQRLLASWSLTSGVRPFNFSPDSRWLGVACADTMVRIVDARTGGTLKAFCASTQTTAALAFTPGSTHITTVAEDVRIWDVGTGLLARSPLHAGVLNGVAAFSASGERLVTVSRDGLLRVWMLPSGAVLTNIAGISAQSVIVSPNGQLAVTSRSEYPTETVQIWDIEHGRAVAKPLIHPRELWSIGFSPDSALLVTCCEDNMVRVMNAATGESWCESIRGSIYTQHAAFTSDSRLLAVPVAAGRTRLWDVSWSRALPLYLPPKEIREAHWQPHSLRILTASRDGTARLWNARDGLPLIPHLNHSNVVRIIRAGPDGTRFVTASTGPFVQLVQYTNGVAKPSLLPNESPISDARFDPTGNLLLTVGKDASLRIWDVRRGECVAVAQSAMKRSSGWGPVRQSGFSPLDSRVYMGCEDGTVREWEWAAKRPDRVLATHVGPVWDCRISPDGKRLATGSLDRTASLIELPSGLAVTPPLQHQGDVSCVSFSPNGRKLLTASWDGMVRVWDGRSGRAIGPVLKHAQPVQYAEFSPDGTRIVAACMDHTARIWDAELGVPLTVPLKHPARVHQVEFSPDGRFLLTVCYDWRVRVWEVPAPTGSAPAWLSDLAEAFAGQRINRHGVIEDASADALAQLGQPPVTHSALDTHSVWARWFAADRPTRTIAPSFSQTVPEYLASCLADGSITRLQEAVRLAPADESVRLRLSEAIAREATNKVSVSPDPK